MKLVQLFALASLSILSALGCSAEAQSTGLVGESLEVQNSQKGGYGYEFIVDHLEGSSEAPTSVDVYTDTGRISPEEIQRRVRAEREAMRACAGQSTGKVTIAFFIEPDGAVSGAETTGEGLSDPALFACMSGVVEGISFPSSQFGRAKVIYPIELGSRAASDNAG